MSEPTGRLSLYDLLLKVAKAGGVAYYGSAGASKAMVPLDAHDLDKCLGVVNDGVRLFMSSAPLQGWRWQNRLAEITFATVQVEGTVDSGSVITLVDATLHTTYDADDDLVGYYCYDLTKEIYAVITDYTTATGTVIIGTGTANLWHTYDDKYTASVPVVGDHFHITNVKTVCGDKTRYFLPDDFNGDVSGRITYAQSTGHGHLIDWCDESTIRTNQEVTLTTGYPMYAAVRPSPVRRKWELVIDPSPTAGDTVVFPYRVGFNKFQTLTGTATGETDATELADTSLANLYPTDYFKGWTAEIIAGTGQNGYAEVQLYDKAGSFGVTKWLAPDGSSTNTAPATSSIYYVHEGYTHPAGMSYDQAILSACLCVAEQEFEDLQLGYVERFYKVDLPLAYQLDARSAPRKLGVMQPATGVRRNIMTWNDVTYPGNEE